MHTLMTSLGMTLPIIQAPMAGVQDWELCAAVSEIGGLGSLPCAMLSGEQIVAEVSKIRAVSSKPFNLNFFCHAMPDIDEQALAKWQSLFSEDYQEFQISPERQLSGKLRQPFNAEMASLVEALKPPVVSFHFGLPSEQLLTRVRRTGAVVLSSATTLDEALWLEQKGVDAVIVQGVEAGGHRGMFRTTSLDTQLPLFELLRQCKSHLTCPVIASGGIGTDKDVKLAMDTGACAVQIGTAYLLCDETKTSAIHRQALEQHPLSQTVITNIFSGRPARGMINGMINRLGAINPMAPAFPYAALATGALRTEAEKQNISDYTPLWSGTKAVSCKKIPAANMTLDLARSVVDTSKFK